MSGTLLTMREPLRVPIQLADEMALLFFLVAAPLVGLIGLAIWLARRKTA